MSFFTFLPGILLSSKLVENIVYVYRWRAGHIAWTPSSLPNSVVLIGGIGYWQQGYTGPPVELTAEIVPGVQNHEIDVLCM